MRTNTYSTPAVLALILGPFLGGMALAPQLVPPISPAIALPRPAFAVATQVAPVAPPDPPRVERSPIDGMPMVMIPSLDLEMPMLVPPADERMPVLPLPPQWEGP